MSTNADIARDGGVTAFRDLSNSPNFSIDPNDGRNLTTNNGKIYANDSEIDDESPLLKRMRTSESSFVKPSDSWERRPSFLGLGSSINISKENDRLLNYIEKSSRLDTVHELRHLSLIGNVTSLFDWSKSFKDDDDLKKIKNKKLRNFYSNQNELIEKFQEVDKLLDSGIQVNMIRHYSDRNDQRELGGANSVCPDDDGVNYGAAEQDQGRRSLHRKDSAVPGNVDLETGALLGYNKADEIKLINFAILVNFAANIFLLFGKVVVAVLTSSISIVASVIDSALDFLSTLIIYFSNKLANTKNPKRFPIGRARLEPIGVLVFSIIIIISFLQVGIESIQRLIYSNNDEIVAIGFTSIFIMVITILVKLVCYIWCKSIKSSSIAALAQDALVDVVFNTFSIIMPVLGHHFQLYWFDPLGALLLSVYIVVQWSYTCFEHIIHLTGKSADKDDERVILYLCSRFAEKIQKIKAISCYHVGDSLNVEVDLILDSKLSLRDSHDLAEALQYTLEALPVVNIERAFVHIDYTVTNYRGHLS